MSGPMCGVDEVLEWAEGILHPSDTDVLPERILRRLEYTKRQSDGAVPNHHKGLQGPVYDWDSCGNCGHSIRTEEHYCPACGFYILWPKAGIPREISDLDPPWTDEDYLSFFHQQAEIGRKGETNNFDFQASIACETAFREKIRYREERKEARESRERKTKRLIHSIEKGEEEQTKRVYYADEVIKIVRKCREF